MISDCDIAKYLGKKVSVVVAKDEHLISDITGELKWSDDWSTYFVEVINKDNIRLAVTLFDYEDVNNIDILDGGEIAIYIFVKIE